MAQQAEAHQRLHSQSALTPKNAVHPKKAAPKDLTSSLLETNLSQLNLLATKPLPQSNYTGYSSTLWNTNNHQHQWQTLDATSPMSQSKSNASGWNTNGPNTMNWGSPALTPVNPISDWNSPKPQYNLINKNSTGAFEDGIMGSMTMSTSLSNTNKTQQHQHTKSSNLSTQDIIDFLS